MELRNRNSSTAFCSHSFTCFTCFYIFSHFFTWSKRMFSHFFQSHFQKAFFLHCFTFFHKNVKRCEKKNIWKSSWEGGTLFFFFRFDFLGPSFAAITLLPAQLLQVENRRGAVQIDRKWTVQIADLFFISIAKQWLPGAKTENQMQKEKRT